MSSPEQDTFPAADWVPFAEDQVFKSYDHDHPTKSLYAIQNRANYNYVTSPAPGVVPEPIYTAEEKRNSRGDIDSSQMWIVKLVDKANNFFTIHSVKTGEPFAYCNQVVVTQPVELGSQPFTWNIWARPNGNKVITPAQTGKNSFFWGLAPNEGAPVTLRYQYNVLQNQWHFIQV